MAFLSSARGSRQIAAVLLGDCARGAGGISHTLTTPTLRAAAPSMRQVLLICVNGALNHRFHSAKPTGTLYLSSAPAGSSSSPCAPAGIDSTCRALVVWPGTISAGTRYFSSDAPTGNASMGNSLTKPGSADATGDAPTLGRDAPGSADATGDAPTLGGDAQGSADATGDAPTLGGDAPGSADATGDAPTLGGDDSSPSGEDSSHGAPGGRGPSCRALVVLAGRISADKIANNVKETTRVAAGDEETDDTEAPYNPRWKEIRLERIRVMQLVDSINLEQWESDLKKEAEEQAATSERLKLRESTVSQMEGRLEQTDVPAGLFFEVEGVHMTMQDVLLQKSDIKNVLHARNVGANYKQGIEDVKRAVREAFKNLSENNKSVMASQLRKAFKASLDSLSEEDRVIVVKELRRLILVAGGIDIDSLSEEKTRGPRNLYEVLIKGLAQIPWLVLITAILFLLLESGIYLQSTEYQTKALKEICIGYYEFLLAIPLGIYREAMERVNPPPSEDTVCIELIFDLGSVKVKVASSNLTKPELGALLEAQKKALEAQKELEVPKEVPKKKFYFI